MGTKQWDQNYGGTANDLISSVQQTSDGGYVLGGYSFSDSSGNKTRNSYGSYDYWVVKIDSVGSLQWDRVFGGTDDDELTSLRQTSDKGYILGGTSLSGTNGSKTQSSFGNYDYWVIKIDSLGNEQWEKEYGGAEDDILYALQQTVDKGYILAGVSSSGISGNKTQLNWDTTLATRDFWIVKIDSSGGIQWDKDFGGTNMEESIGTVSMTLDGGYLVARRTSYSSLSGDKTENNLGFEQTWLVKTDSSGNKKWDKTIFTTAEDESGYALQTKEGYYLVANYTAADSGGYKTQNSRGFDDYWIVKFCDSSLTTGINPAVSFNNELSVYPNPCSAATTISLPDKNITISIVYDV